jgi:hypothetical protein
MSMAVKQAEFANDVADSVADDHLDGEVARAAAEEIQLRVAEIRDGTAKTYDAEDVLTAMRLRFG